MTMGHVILVDEQDTPVGVAEKLAAHRLGQLHRAFSILVFGEKGLLLQQRAVDKYHSGGLWSNTCCGHPLPGETIAVAASRRLNLEMGLSPPLEEILQLRYRLEIGTLVEHELDHVLVGWTDAHPVPEASEVSEWRWVDPGTFHLDLKTRPSIYTAWLPLVWSELIRASGGAESWGLPSTVAGSLRSLDLKKSGKIST